MNLLDRYLQAVAFWLPKGQKQDITAELSEEIRSQIEEREASLGRALSDAELETMLQTWGSPLVVAERYLPTRFLIGPTVFPIYALLLRKFLTYWLLPWIAIQLLWPLFQPGVHSADFSAAFAQAIGTMWTVAVNIFAFLTLGFVILDRVNARSRLLEQWNPKAIKAARHPLEISRTAAINEAVWGLIALSFFLSWRHSPTILFVRIAPAEHVFYWPIVILQIAAIALASVNAVRPRWTKTRSLWSLAINAYALLLTGLLLASGPWLETSVPSLNLACVISLLVIGFTYVLHSIRDVRNLLRRERSLSSVLNASAVTLLLFVLLAPHLCAQDGASLYKSRCSQCHDSGSARVPPFSALRSMDRALIAQALTTGVMKPQAAGLAANEISALAAYISTTPSTPASAPDSASCPASHQPADASVSLPGWTAWGSNFANTRFQSVQAAGVSASEVPKLKLKWAFGLGTGALERSQPAVAYGRVFAGSQAGFVYALDAQSGCMFWKYRTVQPVRSGIAVGPPLPSTGHPAIYFGDHQAHLYAVDAITGSLLWNIHVDNHFAAMITGTPQIHAGVVYVPVASLEEALPASPAYGCCTFRGSIVAVDAVTGKQVWKTYTIAEPNQPTRKNSIGTQLFGPSGASVWSSPTYDEKTGAIYVATGDNYSTPTTTTSDSILALDSKTGAVLWSRQVTPHDAYNSGCDVPGKANCPDPPGGDFDFGQPPILVSLSNGNRALVIAQKSGIVWAFDPDQKGKLLWQTRVGIGGALGGSVWGSAADRENMYVPVSDVRLQWIPDASQPKGGRLQPDPTKGGGLTALRLATGEKVWNAQPAVCGDRQNCSPAQSAPASGIDGIVFSGALDGHLRAYATATGAVVWDTNTALAFPTVNGVDAKGGSLDVSGPVIAGGMVYLNSGYNQWGGMPGNVLLAYSVAGK